MYISVRYPFTITLLYALFIACLGMAVLCSKVPAIIKILGVMGLIVLYMHDMYQLKQHQCRGFGYDLLGWYVKNQENEVERVEFCKHVYFMPWLMIFSYRTKQTSRRFRIYLTKNSMTKHEYRQLNNVCH